MMMMKIMVMMKITWHCFLRSHCGHNFCDPGIKKSFFFRQGNWCPIILRWWKWHQWSRLLFCYSSVLPQDVEAWYPISAKTRATTFGSWAVLLWLDRVFSMFSSQNETLHIFEIQFWELCSLSSTVIQKKTLLSVPVLETWVRPRTDLGSVGCLFHTWCLTFSTRLPSIKLCKDLFRFILVFWFDRSSICKRVPIGEKYTNKTHRPQKYNK